MALQGSSLLGCGWAAAGTIADAEVDRNYHYGVCPQSLLALRGIAGDVAMLDCTTRAYYLEGTGPSDRAGHELILRARVALALRVIGHHALAVQYVVSTRDAAYDDPALTDTFQRIGSFGILWSYLGDSQFGIVD